MSTELVSRLRSLPLKGLGTPLLLVMAMAMMLLPMPPLLLDFFFTFNIALALIVLLVTIYTDRPLDFAAFPTVLLVATLLRLALNVASTRVVLLEGHNGPEAAGQVIAAFGHVVVGGNYAVGIVVFIILMIINFVVVTKGAGRISEVTARFTLDAMPGKQMAIDADLNAGLINQAEAKLRRSEVAREAEFYGSMDGASKFVRGDAVAGILVLFINIIGGLLVGMLQHNLSFSLAMEYYILLTIGDGLVAQVPSMLLSVASAIMVTRQANASDMSSQMLRQMFDKTRPLIISAIILAIMGLVPGMPHLAFLGMAAISAGIAYWMSRQPRQPDEVLEGPATAGHGGGGTEVPLLPGEVEAPRELSWDDVQQVDPIGLEVGYRLIPLVDKHQGGQLLNRIKGVRKKLSQELGFLVPAVHIRDNLELSPTTYRITLMGVTLGEADVYPDKEMAINPGQVFGDLPGIATRDPAFNLEAVWIASEHRDQAQTLGYTVVDSSTVVATHLSQLLQTHAAELLGHEEVQQLLKMLEKTTPKLAGTLGESLPMSTLVRVLQNLLTENVPIRDLRSIAEALAEHSSKSQDPVLLTAAVRMALKRLIVQSLFGNAVELPVLTLDARLEQILQQSVQVAGDDAGLEPGLADRLQKSLVEQASRQEAMGQPTVLLCSTQIRSVLSRFARQVIPGMAVLSFHEIPDSKQIRIVGTVGN